MRFYRIDWRDSEPTAQQTDWATSYRDARKIARGSVSTPHSGDPEDFGARILVVDVPTDRAGLLAWLQANIWRP